MKKVSLKVDATVANGISSRTTSQAEHGGV